MIKPHDDQSYFGYQLTYERCDGRRASEFAAALTPLFLAVPTETEHEQGIAPQLRRSGIGAHDIRRWCWR
jgi:hypothetical protein